MHGLGNSQLITEDLNKNLEKKEQHTYGEIARALCHPGFGVGSDQMLVILPSKTADYRMRIFNKDGGEAEMCGNGIRCVAKYLYDRNKVDQKPKIETKAGIKELEIFEGPGRSSIEVDMGKAILKEDNKKVNGFCGSHVSVGNPHFVVITDRASKEFALENGPDLENASDFHPEKTNVEFVNPSSRKEIETYVWERGAGLTLACGTGACAAAFVTRKRDLTDKEVQVNLLGGSLTIKVDNQDGIKMEGPAEYILEGDIFDVSPIFSHVSDLAD